MAKKLKCFDKIFNSPPYYFPVKLKDIFCTKVQRDLVGGWRGAWVRLPLPHKNLSSGRLYKDSHCGFHPHIRRQMPNLCKYIILCLSIFTDGLHLFLAELLCPFNIWPVRISPSRGQLPLKIPEVCLSFFDPISQTKSRSTISQVFCNSQKKM